MVIPIQKLLAPKLLLLLAFACITACAQAETGSDLRGAIIWYPVDSSIAVGFRKEFNLPGPYKTASLCIFADSKYMLYINGVYVMRGPCRFDPKRPEYDSLEVGSYLKPGNNTIAVLVYGHISNGDAMQHDAGLTIQLQAGPFTLTTDASWRCNNSTRFGKPDVNWDGIRENVRADKEDGDWVQPGYNDAAWQLAVAKDKNLWGDIKPRITPLPIPHEVPYMSASLPYEVRGRGNVYLELKKNIMGYCILRFNADAGSKISVFGHHYTAKKGDQEYVTADVFASGMTNIFATDIEDQPDSVSVVVHVDSGRVQFTDIRVVNFVAPLTLVGSFQSSDSMLNRFWKVITNMHAQITQDTYTDGASEGNEWVADVHNISQFTKVAFAGTDNNGELNYSEKRHLMKALSDIAVSQQPDGRVKAHHPSDRFDLHWFIEDFACIWIGDIRNYYDMTRDTVLLNRLWPAVKRQLAWFKDSINANGLVHGREWGIFDNPYAYKRGEGGTLNAWVFKAFTDGAYLAQVYGEGALSNSYTQIAANMKAAFNKYFWNEKEKTFAGMKDSLVTTHAAVFSLYTGICSDEHKADVERWLMKRKQDSIIYPFIHVLWFKDLYDMNTKQADQQVLNIIHTKYNNKWNAYNKGYITSEQCDGGRNFHNFGMAPGYFFSAYVLGVRTDGPIWTKHILIEPRLANLRSAEGTVVTEYGPVKVSWSRNVNDVLAFSFTVPAGVTARVGIPKKADQSKFVLNGVDKSAGLGKDIETTGRFIYLDGVTSGTYSGKVY